jgi:hypothetical protein
MNIRKSLREAVRVLVSKAYGGAQTRNQKSDDPERRYEDMVADSRRRLAKGR